ncbi:pyridoxal phosphate-dependent transferase [Jimgerdemannia flammicorona]|uniref:cystathionine gamma-lyase n=1 Tax=Jimgerdemannia flammicorona TaxID=994334 RepID=A0A433DLG7_9FUNG|nr:pyridoxal phosphate-dependent transferase [Jimgerdemannia flammicorona]
MAKGNSSTEHTNHSEVGFSTRAVHAGQEPDKVTGAVIPPISLSTTFKQPAAGEHLGFDYSRSGNPTRQVFEKAVAALEKGKYGLAFSSGSATTASIVQSLGADSHVISVNDVYGGTYRYFTKVASQFGISTDFVDMYDPNNIERYFKPNTKLVWIETPTNPTLRLVDIRAIAKRVHNHGAMLVVDNTFLSPYFQNPLELGADVVIHSVTKYINGHSDVVMGIAVTNNEDFYNKLKFMQNSFGAVPSPFDCYLARCVPFLRVFHCLQGILYDVINNNSRLLHRRGLMTLEVRMKAHASNAMTIARFLEKHRYINEVIYPGLPSHPQHELAQRQQKGFGGMLSFRMKGTLANVNAFLSQLQYITLAESLGGVESLIEVPAVMTHGSISTEDRALLGITDTLVRFSVGIENVEDLMKDLDQALEHAYVSELKH